jgi:uncharacterized protein YbjT (DUF2867 family)
VLVIAGASGKTGRVVAETLLAQGKKIRVIVRNAAQGEAWRARGAQIALASLDDADALRRALDGATGFYALLPEDVTVRDFHAHRRRMADAMAAAVKASGVPHVVMLSAVLAVLPDGNGPGKDLHYAENALRATGSKITALRPVSFQENVMLALQAAQYEGIYPNFLPSADIPFPAIATQDVGRIAARCLVEPPKQSEIIDLVGPLCSVRQMAEKLGGVLGKSLRVVDLPAAAHIEVLTKANLPQQFAEAVAEMYACLASGLVSPRGNRTLSGATTLDDILPSLISAST